MAVSRRKEDTTEATTPTVTDANKQQMQPHRYTDDIVPEVMGGRTASEYDDDALREAKTWDDFVGMVGPQNIVDAAEVLGDGFTVLEKDQKRILCGVPVLFLSWTFSRGDYGRPFASIHCVAQLPGVGLGKFIINDGGSGLAEQLAKFTVKAGGESKKLLVKKGLKASDYTKEIPDPENPEKTISIESTTYYIDTSAA